MFSINIDNIYFPTFHLLCMGVSAGVRHSIGGADYGSVRAGAFMGLRIMTQLQADRGPQPLGQLFSFASTGMMFCCLTPRV